MENQQVHFRHLMLFYYRKDKNAVQTAKKICGVYGDNAVSDRTVREWFVKFRRGEFTLEDQHRSGRRSTVDDDQIKALIRTNQRITTREIAERLKVSNSTIHDHLVRLGFTSRLDVWVPHKLSEHNLLERISKCDLLLKRNENQPFLKRMITGDEKWVVYNNVERKRSWGRSNEPPLTTPKTNIHTQKVMLCCWWDWKGIIYYELLPRNETINSDKYCKQLDNLKEAIEQKRPELANHKKEWSSTRITLDHTYL